MRVRFGELVFDLERHELLRGSDLVHLSPKAFELLHILIRERPRVVSSRDLYDRLWPDTFVGRGSLHALVSQIRRALNDREHAIVRAHHGIGFSFEAAGVEEDAAPATWSLFVGTDRFVLHEGENVVGRASPAGVRIPSPSVSRRHAAILITGSAATLHDLGSKNGTFVGERPVRRATPLSSGVEIVFGTVHAVLTIVPSDPTTRTAVPDLSVGNL